MYVNVSNVYIGGPMGAVAARLDDLPKPIWIGAAILGFALYWPVGLAILGYIIWSRKMGCWHHGRHARWNHEMRETAERWVGCGGGGRSSGNPALHPHRQGSPRRPPGGPRRFRRLPAPLRRDPRQRAVDPIPPPRR